MIRHKVMTLFSFAAMILPMFFIAAKPSVSSLNGETSSQKTAPLEITKSTKTIPQGIVNHQWRETLLPSQASLTGEVVRTPISYDYATWSNTDIQQVIRLDSQPAYVEYQVNVPQAYEIVMTMDYLPLDLGIRDIEIAVMVNGEYPFADAEQITLKKWWITPHSFATDRYENEIMPKATLDQSWRAQPLMDSQRLQANPLLWSLQPGINTIRILALQGAFLLGSIYFTPLDTPPSYGEYLNLHGNGILQNQSILKIEAEHLASRNSLLARFSTNREPNVSPFALIEGKLNVLDGATYQTPGQTITYDVEVTASGFYHLTFKVLQNRIQSISYRRLRINGEVPFAEANLVAFPANRQWQQITLGPLEGEPFQFYFPAGTHQISLEVNASPFAESYESIRNLMNDVNALSLAIKKITGNTIDPNREWNLLTYLPNLIDNIDRYIQTLDTVSLNWKTFMNAGNESDVLASIKIAKQLLTTLRNNVDAIPRRIETLSGSSGSVLYRLGIMLPLLIQSPLTIDQFYLHGNEATLPSPTAGFFRVIWIGIQRFFASFFSDQFKDSSNPNELVVWVSRSRQYVNLLQQMVDAEFTPMTGIPVRIQINPNEEKLILASSAGNQPDIAMGIAGWRPYDFAIRNNVYNLSTFEDFRDVSNRFYPGSFMQLIYQDGVYGLPETQNFYLLFYRQDIMNRLQLDVPSTWDDVISMLPELQRFGMNFYSMLSSTNAFKAFVLTMPFIRQFNGRIFSEDGLSAAYDDPNTIEALTLMTDLFTTYSLPLEVGSFYNEFRYGRLPIGIGDFGMYISLLHAAPEIAGLWNIAPLPGIEQNGVVNRSFDGSSTSAM
ncbi:MAG: extracellular solute-binding protein, partial [Bacilli bacterium]